MWLCVTPQHWLMLSILRIVIYCFNGFTSRLAAFGSIDITKQQGKMFASQDFSAPKSYTPYSNIFYAHAQILFQSQTTVHSISSKSSPGSEALSAFRPWSCLELVGWCRAGIKAQSPNSLTKCRLVAWDTPAMPVLLHSLALAQHSRYFSGDGKSKRASRGSRNEERTTG